MKRTWSACIQPGFLFQGVDCFLTVVLGHEAFSRFFSIFCSFFPQFLEWEQNSRGASSFTMAIQIKTNPLPRASQYAPTYFSPSLSNSCSNGFTYHRIPFIFLHKKWQPSKQWWLFLLFISSTYFTDLTFRIVEIQSQHTNFKNVHSLKFHHVW